MIKILHTADWHCRGKDLPEINRCLTSLVEVAQDKIPDVIVIAGDIYDSQQVKLDSDTVKLVFLYITKLSEIAPVAIITGTRSHEGNATEVLSHIPNVYVSKIPEALYLNKSVPFLSKFSTNPIAILSMVPTPTKQFFEGHIPSGVSIEETDAALSTELGKIFADFGANTATHNNIPNILVGHFQVKGSYVSETQQLIGRDIEISKDCLIMAQATLVCLGHIHMQQKLWDNCFYSGSLYSTNIGETEQKGFYIHTIIDNSIESEFIHTPAQKKYTQKIDLTADEYSDITKIQPIDCEMGAFVKIEIKEFQDKINVLDTESIKQKYITQGIEVDIHKISIPRVNVRSKKILSLASLPEKIKERAKILDENIPSGVPEKANMLETMPEEDIIKNIKTKYKE